MDQNLFPPPPEFTDELVEKCRHNQDAMPLVFEWYKYVGVLVLWLACVDQDSPVVRSVKPIHYAILTGLLNRCSRLMLANVRLAAGVYYGETPAIIDRVVFETTMKIRWLCLKDSAESFQRFLAEGLRRDLVLKKQVLDNISKRDDSPLVIEQRMLASIQRFIGQSQLVEAQILRLKPLPNLSSMCCDLKQEDLFYTVFQRMGSHAVHGTWTDLVRNYLQQDEDGTWRPRDHNVRTEDTQLAAISLLAIEAMKAFSEWAFEDSGLISALYQVSEGIKEKIKWIMEISMGQDFELADDATIG